MRLIDGDALIHKLKNSHYPGEPEVNAGIGIAIGKVWDAPIIEPERKKGTWIYGESEIGNDGYYCSVCGNFVPWKYGEYDIDFIKEFLFCNKCGADMREGEQE